MLMWAFVLIGAACLIAGFYLVVRGVGGQNARTKITLPGGFDFELSEVGQGAIFAGFGIVVLFLATQVSVPVRSPDQKSKVITYERTGTGELGKFEQVGLRWKETFSDTQAARIWVEDKNSAPPGRIRLRDGNATVDIDPTTMKVYYTDPTWPKYPWPQPLDDIIKIDN